MWERPFPWANPRSRSRMCSLKVSIVHIVCVVAVVAGIGSEEADLWRPEPINTIGATTIIIIIDPPSTRLLVSVPGGFAMVFLAKANSVRYALKRMYVTDEYLSVARREIQIAVSIFLSIQLYIL